MLLFLLKQLFSLSNFLALLKATPESVFSFPLTLRDAQSGYASSECPPTLLCMSPLYHTPYWLVMESTVSALSPKELCWEWELHHLTPSIVF